MCCQIYYCIYSINIYWALILKATLHTEYRYKQVGFYTWLANIQAKENNIEEWVNE